MNDEITNLNQQCQYYYQLFAHEWSINEQLMKEKEIKENTQNLEEETDKLKEKEKENETNLSVVNQISDNTENSNTQDMEMEIDWTSFYDQIVEDLELEDQKFFENLEE